MEGTVIKAKLYTPRPYQTIMSHHILSFTRSAIWAGMGMGKTAATLDALSALKLVEEGPTLVLAPLRVAANVWPTEVAKWSNFKHLRLVDATGTGPERERQLNKPADIYTLNYENLPWLVALLGKQWPFTTVIADESTRLKNFRLNKGGQRSRALARAAFSRVKRFIELTGTPSPNGLKDLWGQLWFLDRGERLGRTYTSFTRRWFRYPHPEARHLEPTEFAQAQIENKVKDMCLSLDPSDWFDLEKLILVDIPVTLPAHVQKMYKRFERDMFLKFAESGTEIEALNAAALTTKCLQLANGAVYTEGNKKWENVHGAKLDALESIIEENAGAPLLVAYHFKSDLARLKMRFPQGRYLDKKKTTEDAWNAGEIPLLFIHPGSAAHGLNLQDGGHRIVFFSHWWDLEQYQQVFERIGPVRQMQSGYKRPVFVYNIRAVDTVDDLIIERRKSKKTVQDMLLVAVKKTNP